MNLISRVSATMRSQERSKREHEEDTKEGRKNELASGKLANCLQKVIGLRRQGACLVLLCSRESDEWLSARVAGKRAALGKEGVENDGQGRTETEQQAYFCSAVSTPNSAPLSSQDAGSECARRKDYRR